MYRVRFCLFLALACFISYVVSPSALAVDLVDTSLPSWVPYIYEDDLSSSLVTLSDTSDNRIPHTFSNPSFGPQGTNHGTYLAFFSSSGGTIAGFTCNELILQPPVLNTVHQFFAQSETDNVSFTTTYPSMSPGMGNLPTNTYSAFPNPSFYFLNVPSSDRYTPDGLINISFDFNFNNLGYYFTWDRLQSQGSLSTIYYESKLYSPSSCTLLVDGNVYQTWYKSNHADQNGHLSVNLNISRTSLSSVSLYFSFDNPRSFSNYMFDASTVSGYTGSTIRNLKAYWKNDFSGSVSFFTLDTSTPDPDPDPDPDPGNDTNFFVSLWVPSVDQLTELHNKCVSFLDDKFSLCSQAIAIIDSTIESLLSSTSSTALTFPAISFPLPSGTVTLTDPVAFDFNGGLFPVLRPVLSTSVCIVVTLLFLNFLRRFVESILSGHSISDFHLEE